MKRNSEMLGETPRIPNFHRMALAIEKSYGGNIFRTMFFYSKRKTRC
jgi:hypothetical protein